MQIQPFTKISLLLLATILAFGSCSETENEDLTQTVNKEAAIETSVTVVHQDSADVLVTLHRVWKDNELVKTIEYKDTVPSLGTKNIYPKDDDGNTSTKTVNKDYEIFITVK